MHLLICSFYYGKSAEGICTLRLAHALSNLGLKITLLSGPEAASEKDSNIEVVKFRDTPFFPLWFFKIASKYILRGSYNSCPFWYWRASRYVVPCHIDLIYGRAHPIASIRVAASLSKKTKIPLFIHLSDPVPHPWLSSYSLSKFWEKSYISKFIKASDGISFTTEEAIGYEENELSMSLASKAFVLPHVIPNPTILGARANTDDKVRFLYAGTLYAIRGVKILLEAFHKFIHYRSTAEFLFLGSARKLIMPHVDRLHLHKNVHIIDYVSDVAPYYRDSDILVAIDANDTKQVFLPSKLIEYIMYDRPILMITPKKSPSAKVTDKFSDSIVTVEEDASQILEAMTRLTRIKYSASFYENRFNKMECFSPSRVANVLNDRIEHIIKKKRQPLF